MKNVWHLDTDSVEVKYDEKNRRIYITQEKEKDAELQYELQTSPQPNVINFTSIYVPVALREMGFGEKLAHKGMEFAEANGYKVIANCPFVQDFMDKNVQYKHLYQKR